MSTQNVLDKVTREKTGLMSELDDVKLQLRKYDKEVTMVTEQREFPLSKISCFVNL